MMTEFIFFFFQAEDGIRDLTVTGVQTCALPIFPPPTPDIAIKTPPHGVVQQGDRRDQTLKLGFPHGAQYNAHPPGRRSEEHTSELQSQSNLVCRLLLEKKKKLRSDFHSHQVGRPSSSSDLYLVQSAL